ncbi:hypothetical protein [Streptomyces syringium]|uniref:hypothetical protein n=1 Tax=Streptomyces syringium TaxID=76729 RepID=UPI0037D8C050
MARTPNTRLLEAINEAGVTYAALARAVRGIAIEAGDATLRTNASCIAHWVAGTAPDPATVPYLVEALARRLGRPLSPADLGLCSGDHVPADLGLSIGPDPVETITLMGRADIERRTFLTRAAYSAAATALPLGLAAEHRARAATVRAGGAAGQAEIDAVRDMTAAFTRIDERYGGQHGRGAVLHYLTTDVAGLCRATFRTGQQHAEMLIAAGSLAYLAGWKAYDAGEQGLAQRYYLQAYALTREAGDEPHSAFALRILAHHAMDVGRHEHTEDLAEAALTRASGRVDPATESLFVICRARALAVTGRPRQAVAEAVRARTLADRRTDGMTGWATMWGSAAAMVDSHTAHILTRLGDHREAERYHASAARRYDGTEHQRIKALSSVAEGRAQCAQGHIEQACATWGRALDAMTGVRSSRTRQAVTAIRTDLNRFRGRDTRAARELDERARTWLTSCPA